MKFLSDRYPNPISELGREQLDRDRAVEVDLAGEVDDAHAAAAQLPVYRIPAGQRLLKGEEQGVGGRAGLEP